jgi:hypothetical protein
MFVPAVFRQRLLASPMAGLSWTEVRHKRRPVDHASSGSFETMFRYPPVFSVPPRLSVAASLMGFCPSQFCSCPQAALMFPSTPVPPAVS